MGRTAGLALRVESSPMIGIAAVGVFNSSGQEGVVWILLFGIAAAFVLCCSICNRCTVSNCVPPSFALLLDINIRHSHSLSLN